MAKVFILVACSYLAGNIYIYIRGLQLFQSSSAIIKWIYSSVFWLCALSIVLMLFLRNTRLSALPVSHLLFEFSSGWLVFTLYMGLLLLAFECLRVFNITTPYTFIIALSLTIGILIRGFENYQHPVTKVINIDFNKPSTSPPASFKIVAVSDIHLGMGTSKRLLQKYIQMIQSQQPDLILIGGDLVDNSILSVMHRHFETDLSQLHAPYGVYMVPGNHEYISGITDCIRYIGQTPVRLLRDSTVTLPNGVQIVGRDDRSNPARKTLPQLLKGINHEYPVIVIDHQPNNLSEPVDAGIDLLFCGHTHRGQVWPMSWLTDRMFDISYGYEKRINTNIYVSSGLSIWGPPFRIGTQSEMIVFNISFGK